MERYMSKLILFLNVHVWISVVYFGCLHGEWYRIFVISQRLNYTTTKIFVTFCNNYIFVFRKKNNLVDQEISLLREKEDNVKLLSNNAEKALEKVLGMLTDTIDTFGSAVNKLNDHITDSMKNV